MLNALALIIKIILITVKVKKVMQVLTFLKARKNPTLEVPRKSTRGTKSPVRYPEKESYNIYVRYCRVDTPCTFEEAMNSKESKNWQETMNKEIECINKNKTWTLVDRVQNKKIIDLKWVYTRKADNRYKARLVVRGFEQTDVIADIYSPVAKNQTLKILLSYCCQNRTNGCRDSIFKWKSNYGSILI